MQIHGYEQSPYWQTSKDHIGKNTVRRSDYKGVSRVSIISEHVKDPIIKMPSSTNVTPTTSNIAYCRGVTAYQTIAIHSHRQIIHGINLIFEKL